MIPYLPLWQRDHFLKSDEQQQAFCCKYRCCFLFKCCETGKTVLLLLLFAYGLKGKRP